MADLDLEWRGDLGLDASGDLLLVDGNDMVEQHIIRRLLTAYYVWHPEYGANLPARIGNVATASNIRALVRANIALEATVARTPVPVVTVAEDETTLGLYNIGIRYTSAVTGASVALSFELPTR